MAGIKAGKPILVNGDGTVLGGDFKDVEDAVNEAKRLARKNDDEVFVYVATKRVGPTEPKVEAVDL